MTPSADTDVRENSGGTNNCGSCTELVTRFHATGEYRPVYRFNLSGIPAGSRLVSATLRLWVTDPDSGATNIYRVTTDWSEATATWANTGGMAHNGTVRGSFTPASSGQFHDIDLTALVGEWMTGTPNYGVVLRATAGYAMYTSKEWGTVSQRPQLVVVVLPPPQFSLTNTTSVIWDPVNANLNPKRIPASLVRYDVAVSNSSAGTVDADTLVLVETVPSQMALFVGDLDGVGSGPVRFTQGSPSSGLTYTYSGLSSTTDDLDFSADGGASWTYDPSAYAGGYDPSITHVRIRPKGAFAGSTGSGNPGLSVTMRFRAD